MLLEELPLELPPLILRPLCVASSEVERYLAMSSNELGDLVAISESESTISSPSRYHLVTPRHHLVTISSSGVLPSAHQSGSVESLGCRDSGIARWRDREIGSSETK